MAIKTKITNEKPKLLDQVRITMRTLHYSKKTEESYTRWIKQFIIYNGKRHPNEMEKEEIQKFINYLAVERHVSSSTQNQALQAILFLYKRIIKKELGWIKEIKNVKRTKHLPVVFSKTEAAAIINSLEGTIKLVVSMLYGTGMRLNECLNLRIKDIDFDMNQIIVRDGKGEKDRITILPSKLVSLLQMHIAKVKKLHQKDLIQGSGKTILPYALQNKYPNANKETGWQFVFPSGSFVFDEKTKTKYRYHIHPTTVQKEIRNAIKKAGIQKPASAHTFRHLPCEIV